MLGYLLSGALPPLTVKEGSVARIKLSGSETIVIPGELVILVLFDPRTVFEDNERLPAYKFAGANHLHAEGIRTHVMATSRY